MRSPRHTQAIRREPRWALTFAGSLTRLCLLFGRLVRLFVGLLVGIAPAPALALSHVQHAGPDASFTDLDTAFDPKLSASLTAPAAFAITARAAPSAHDAAGPQHSSETAAPISPAALRIDPQLPHIAETTSIAAWISYGLNELRAASPANQPGQPLDSTHALREALDPQLSTSRASYVLAPPAEPIAQPGTERTIDGSAPLTQSFSFAKIPLTDGVWVGGRGWQRELEPGIRSIVLGAEARLDLSNRVDLRLGYELLGTQPGQFGLGSDNSSEDSLYAQFRFRF